MCSRLCWSLEGSPHHPTSAPPFCLGHEGPRPRKPHVTAAQRGGSWWLPAFVPVGVLPKPEPEAALAPGSRGAPAWKMQGTVSSPWACPALPIWERPAGKP